MRCKPHGERVRIILALVLVAAAAAGAQGSGAPSGAAIRLAWAMACRDAEGNTKAVDYAQDVVPLASGDRFAFLLRPLSSCRLYVYLHDAQHDLKLLFPEWFTFKETRYETGRTYRLPAEDGWYYLDERGGTEVFYVVASREPLRRLEKRTLSFLSAGAGSSAAERAERRVLGEIRKLVSESSPLRVAIEEPTVIAGDLRGVQELDDLRGRVIEAEGVYVATIRLRH
jgi:hypothetical protein